MVPAVCELASNFMVRVNAAVTHAITRSIRLAIRHAPPRGRGIKLAHVWTRWNPPDAHLYISHEPSGAKLRCDLRDELSRVLYYRGWVDRELESWITRWLRPGDRYVDVGAHIGYLTALASQVVGQGGQALAYEPAPDTFAKLQSAFSRSAFPQVRTTQAAVGDVVGKQVLFAATGGWDHQSYRNSLHPGEGLEATGSVRVVSLDDELGDKPVRLLKIDVEGGELAVLGGATKLLSGRRCDALVVELNPPALARAGTDVAEVLSVLRTHDFHPHRLASGGRVEPWDPVIFDGDFADAVFLPT
jgi:FkbM family methyltransferase